MELVHIEITKKIDSSIYDLIYEVIRNPDLGELYSSIDNQASSMVWELLYNEE